MKTIISRMSGVFLYFCKTHKKTSVLIILILIGGAIWASVAFSSGEVETKYVLSSVEKGNIITTLEGTGQVSAIGQIDVSPETTGKVVYIPASNGKKVKKGDLLVQLDSTDAVKAVRDAEANYKSAEITYKKSIEQATEIEILKSESDLANALKSKDDAVLSLVKAYDDSFNSISSAFLELPEIMQNLEDIVNGGTNSGSEYNINRYASTVTINENIGVSNGTIYLNKADDSYEKARNEYDKVFTEYKKISRDSDKATLEKTLENTYAMAREVSDAVRDIKNLIDYVEDIWIEKGYSISSPINTHQASLTTFTGTTNSLVSDLLSAKDDITNSKYQIESTERSYKEKNISHEELKAGPDALDIESATLSLKQKENSLKDAREKYADYYIRAPFDGMVANLDVRLGENVSSGSVVAVLVTDQKQAVVSFNEVDVSKVKVGQKATFVFDAVEDLTISGTVSDVALIGSVSQGVVTYNVTVSFDIFDERIKPGMSTTCAIITDSKIGVMTVPVSAIKTVNRESVVEVVPSGEYVLNQATALSVLPTRKIVTVGLSNDELSEIVSGLSVGDIVVSKTVAGTTATKTTTSAPSLIGGGSGRGQGGFIQR